MSTCKSCKSFILNEENANGGECVVEKKDLKGYRFWVSKPVESEGIACDKFEKGMTD